MVVDVDRGIQQPFQIVKDRVDYRIQSIDLGFLSCDMRGPYCFLVSITITLIRDPCFPDLGFISLRLSCCFAPIG